ncbi:hypothetical protein SDC9_19529 [bioreactor metagenome]|uniref:Uncharacterized protein n=1 Tax=bioreactor metagenome TaxID=1076179 RepID=A0A644U478_9ZZZZ
MQRFPPVRFSLLKGKIITVACGGPARAVDVGAVEEDLPLQRGFQHRLRRGLDIERLAGEPQMLFHRCDRQPHQHGNIGRGLAVGHPFQHLALASRQRPVCGDEGHRRDPQMGDRVHHHQLAAIALPDLVDIALPQAGLGAQADAGAGPARSVDEGDRIARAHPVPVIDVEHMQFRRRQQTGADALLDPAPGAGADILGGPAHHRRMHEQPAAQEFIQVGLVMVRQDQRVLKPAKPGPGAERGEGIDQPVETVL